MNEKKPMTKLSSSKPFKDRFRLLVLDCPYDVVSDDMAIDLLGKVIRFKISSYREEYPYGILPFDGVDMVGTHYLLCETTDNGFEPIMGIKTVSEEKCRQFNLSLPVFNLIGEENRHLGHIQAVKSMIEEVRAQGKTLGYFGSWTIRPDVRKDSELSRYCQQLTAALAYHATHYSDFSTVITVAVSKFKVEAFHRFMGLKPLSLNHSILPPFNSAAMMGEQCSCSFLQREWFSEEVKELAERFSSVWEGRLDINARATREALPKAA